MDAPNSNVITVRRRHLVASNHQETTVQYKANAGDDRIVLGHGWHDGLFFLGCHCRNSGLMIDCVFFVVSDYTACMRQSSQLHHCQLMDRGLAIRHPWRKKPFVVPLKDYNQDTEASLVLRYPVRWHLV